MRTTPIISLLAACSFLAPAFSAVNAAGLNSDTASAQAPSSGPPATVNIAPAISTNATNRRGGFRAPPAPRNPVPILPALPAANDASFYASNYLPHGRVETVRYKTSAGAEKRMHVYLPLTRTDPRTL